MIISTTKAIPSSEITDPQLFSSRRQFLKSSAILALAGSVPFSNTALASSQKSLTFSQNTALKPLADAVTPSELATHYNNYYEVSHSKEEPARLAQGLSIDPWSVEVSGLVEKPRTFSIDDLIKQLPLKESIYRFRCVEGWSMVVPWIGFALGDLLKLVNPLSIGRFVRFTSVFQPENLPLQLSSSVLQWPYVEGLRMDEALHPLTIMAVGMYGERLPKQNGAPLRLVVPWKYGFKSAKAIVKIEVINRPPLTSWNQSAPTEYGFYANVNPDVPHPRWSQATERVLGSGYFTKRRQTELFNGYGEQVASLYRDMDLRHFF
jgi:sulfoxide reductase catalytic subunit YedY